jgi:replicative DNA helicase
VAHTDPTTEPAALTAALHYASLGLRVIPIAPGRKHPPVPEWQKAATTDPAIIEAWWTGLYRDHGVGIATGAESGVWVLDVDTAKGKVGAASLAELEALYGPLPATVEAVTGSGGRHLFFTWDPAHPVHNNQSGKVGRDLDVRGEGGQVLAAPTLHPDTHQAYRFAAGQGFGEIVIAPAPTWLYGLLEHEPEPDPRPAPRPALLGGEIDDGPAAAFNASTTWDQLLTRDGWTLATTMGSGEQRWVRPGKSKRDGISATVGHAGHDVLKVFTSSVPELDADKAYSRFGYEAAVRWHGDRSAFASHLRRQMNAERRDDLSDLTDMSWLGDTIATPALAEAATAEAPVGDDWPDPEPLEPELTNGPAFPVEVLPAWMGEAARSCAEALQAPVDLPAQLALGGLSAVTMGKVQIEVDDVDDNPWIEGTNLYLAIALPPGAAKSPAFKTMLGCVRQLERELIGERASVIREAEITKDILTKKAKSAREAAALPGKTADDAKEAGRLQAEADAVVIPSTPRLIADDATPEALARLLATTGERMALMSSEGGLFDMMAGQYTDRGKPTNLDIYLKGWSGDAINIDRASADRSAIALEHPLLSVCVTPQPIMVKRLGENPEMAGRGVSARFLYSVPASNVGGRDRRARRRQRTRGTRAAYEEQMVAIGRRMASWSLPIKLRLSDDAADAFEDWDQEHEDRLAPGQDLAHMAEWVMKLRAYVLRSAALLHIADGRDIHDAVDLETITRAFRLAEYWIEHARCVHTSWGAAINAVAGPARALMRWAAEERIGSFTQREAYLKLRGRDNKTRIEDAVEVLTQLIEMGWLRADGEFPGRRGKTATLLVHPRVSELLHAHDAQPEGPDAHDAQPADAGAVGNPEPARDARCALGAKKETHTPSGPTSPSGPPDPPSTRNAHEAQLVEEAPEPSTPPTVANGEPAAEEPDDEFGDGWSLYDDEAGS